MAEEENREEEATEAKSEGAEEEQEEEQKQYSGEKIMCFVSKQMVPIEDTVELEVKEHKKVRVLPKYIKYDLEEAEG